MVRRELTTRNKDWAIKLARFLAKSGVTPNSVSVLSMLFALISGVFFYLAGAFKEWSVVLLLVAAVSIQLRLLCNMLDGMIAIEHDKKTNTGDVYNDAPDRVADILILLGASLAFPENPFAIYLGFAACLAAVLTAYVRLLGGSLNINQSFQGPMAKQHRMATITAAALLDAFVRFIYPEFLFSFTYLALWVVLFGSVLTCFFRLKCIMQELKEQSHTK